DGASSRRTQQIREAARARGFGGWRGRALPVDIEDWTVAEALLAIDAGTLHPRALTEVYLDRIRRLDGVYRARKVVEGGAALGAAVDRAGSAPGSGRLRGISLPVKDNY